GRGQGLSGSHQLSRQSRAQGAASSPGEAAAAARAASSENTHVRIREWPKDSTLSGVERLVVRNSDNSWAQSDSAAGHCTESPLVRRAPSAGFERALPPPEAGIPRQQEPPEHAGVARGASPSSPDRSGVLQFAPRTAPRTVHEWTTSL